MDIGKVLAQLHQELANLNAAILSLERLQQRNSRRRGRPPAWLAGEKLIPKRARAESKKTRKVSSHEKD
jgi:hypothetical protein